jgi:hypothetical protein
MKGGSNPSQIWGFKHHQNTEEKYIHHQLVELATNQMEIKLNQQNPFQWRFSRSKTHLWKHSILTRNLQVIQRYMQQINKIQLESVEICPLPQ